MARELYERVQTLHADDIAEGILYALSAPAHVQVHDILVRSTNQVS